MPHPTSRRRKKVPKRVLALPDLEQVKSAVLSSLTSRSGQRTDDHAIREFVAWYCSEPRLAFNRTASSGIGFISSSRSTHPRRSTSGWRLCAASRTRRPMLGS
jgi:hypothetical protein